MSLSISRTILGISFLSLFTYTLIAGLNMPFRASMLPVFASSAALPLVLLAIWTEFQTHKTNRSQAENSNGDLAVSDTEVTSEALRRVGYFFVWFICLITSAYLFGFLIALPVMVFIYLAVNREPFKLSVGLSLMVLVILYGGFQKGLVLPLPKGVLTMALFGS